jgi:large subunit ribosomal protein L25
MKSIEVQGELRSIVGKVSAKAARKKGKIPAVIYSNEGPIHIELPILTAQKLVRTQDVYLVQLTLGDKQYPCVIREVQYHPVYDYILHMDFLAVSNEKPIVIELPLKLVGNAKGVLAGGVLVQKMRKLKVRGIPNQLPEFISADVSELELGKSLKIKDIKAEGFDIMNNKDIPVASVTIPRSLRVQAQK